VAVHLVGLHDAEAAQVEQVVRRMQSVLSIRLALMVTRMDNGSPRSPDGAAAFGREAGVTNAAFDAHDRRWLPRAPRQPLEDSTVTLKPPTASDAMLNHKFLRHLTPYFD
jgi:hypothetical protein